MAINAPIGYFFIYPGILMNIIVKFNFQKLNNKTQRKFKDCRKLSIISENGKNTNNWKEFVEVVHDDTNIKTKK